MIRLILHLFLFLFLSSYSCEAYRFSSSDQKVLNSFWKYAEEHRLGNLPVNERIPSIARFFLGTPYQSNTLNVTQFRFVFRNDGQCFFAVAAVLYRIFFCQCL